MGLQASAARERREALRHPPGVSQVKKARRAGELECSTFDSQEASSSSRSEKVGAVFSPRTASASWLLQHACSWVNDQCCRAGSLPGEERLRERNGVLERSREPPLRRLTVVLPEDSAGEGIDGADPVGGAIALDCGAEEIAHELRQHRRRRRPPP